MYFERLNRRAGRHCVTAVVTPAMATEFLTRNTHNRPMTREWVQTYTRDMLAGEFTPGSQIVFDVNGVLADGQKRLKAVIESGVSIEFNIYFNAPEGYRGTADTGQPRPIAVRLSLTGTEASRDLASAARIFALAPNITTNRTDPALIRRVLDGYRDTLEWATGMGIRNAVVAGCIARASLYVSRERLEEFAASYRDGTCTLPERNAPVVLRDFHVRNRPIFAGGTTTRNRAYCAVQACIQAYISNRRLTRCGLVSRDLYPAPEEFAFTNA